MRQVVRPLVYFLLLLTFLGAALLGRQWQQRRDLRDCKKNLNELSTALEMYSTDNTGEYPPELSRLTPNYLKVLPLCPAARRFTYDYQVATNPDAYTVSCRGGWHAR